MASQSRLVQTARALLATGGALESTTSGEQIDADALQGALEAQIRAETMDPLATRVTAAQVVAEAQRALNRVAGGGSTTSLSDLECASLEAIVEVVGRPASRYLATGVELPASALGENDRWRVLIVTARSRINRVSASVGQIVLERPGLAAECIGTGWRLGQDLLVTNRHVVELLADRPAEPCTRWMLDPAKTAAVDFNATHAGGAAARFAIAELAYCTSEDAVDLAILRLAHGPAEPPGPLTLDFSPETLGQLLPSRNGAPRFKGREVYVVGHPFRQSTPNAVRRVFGEADGRKRWSPGVVVQLPPTIRALEHDCSTLGGSSGSCVLSSGSHAVVGLHYGGRGVDVLTARGAANLATALCRLDDHPAAKILRDGKV